MKRILSLVLTITLLLSLAISVTSCKKNTQTLEGSYQDAKDFTTYTFSGNDVTLRIVIIDSAPLVFEGTYEIKENKDGTKTITFDFESEEAEGYTGEYPLVEGVEDGVPYIKIDIIQYKKVQ